MPAPKRPNTAAATAAVRRRGQETMARKLREAGWACIPPEEVDRLRATLDPGAVDEALARRGEAPPANFRWPNTQDRESPMSHDLEKR